MVGWQRHLRSIFRQVGAISEKSYTTSANFSSSCLKSARNHEMSWRLSPTNILRPAYQYLQQSGISSSRKLLADAYEEPISSPLTPTLQLGNGKFEQGKAVSKPAKVRAVLKDIKQSPKKVNLVAALVRGMRVEDALLQLQVTVKRASKAVYQVVRSAQANATHNHGLDLDRLLIAEAFVGKGYYKKRISYHAKGRCGVKMRPECMLTVAVRETTPEEETEIARLKINNFKKLAKRETRLVPHKLIETTPIWWKRKRKFGDGDSNPDAA